MLQALQRFGAARLLALVLAVAGEILRGRMHDHLAMTAVDQHQIVVAEVLERLVRADHHRQAHAAREDRAVRQRAAAGRDHAEHAVLGQMGEFRRRDRVADQHAADARGDLPLGRRGVARQHRLHAADHMIDILAPAAQVWIVDRVERRDHAVALHLQRGAGAIAALADQVVQAADQLRVLENQAVGVDELADFARQRAMQLAAQLVHFFARGDQGDVQPCDFGLDFGFRQRAPVDLRLARLHQARAAERHAARGGGTGDDDARAHAPSSNLRVEQCSHVVQCSFLIGALGAQRDRRADAGGEHHHAHDALGIDLAATMDQECIALIALQQLHELGRCARMQAKLVADRDLAFKHRLS